MTHQVDRWDAEEWLQQNKDIWNHPMVTDRTDRNAYEVADLMAEFTNYIINKQEQKTLNMKQTAVEWFAEKVEQHLLTFGSIQPNVLSKFKQESKEMEKEQQNKMPIHIHEGISNTWVYIEDGVVHVKPNDKTYGGNK
jgi:hypothetical protein